MINYGFKALKEIDLTKEINLPKVELIYGTEQELPVKIKHPFSLYARQDKTFNCTINLIQKIKAPVFEGEKLGTITCQVPNLFGSMMEEELVAATTAEEGSFFSRLLYNLSYFFTGAR